MSAVATYLLHPTFLEFALTLLSAILSFLAIYFSPDKVIPYALPQRSDEPSLRHGVLSFRPLWLSFYALVLTIQILISWWVLKGLWDLLAGVWSEGAKSSQLFQYLTVGIASVVVLMLTVMFLLLAGWVIKHIVEGATEIWGSGKGEGKAAGGSHENSEERIELRREGE